ncbi:putative uncharacterized protein FLJ37770 [Lingula anatina]|uniref:Mos1 transposase HTH domain-containing protein n=1 Tax=Lingula anatina TaxID=7574 RepID=A0A1S3H6E0_LINAN|nr:putative uncharacterized protein FLJ37770 [Lingula anatina]|eukprot:XP_013380694.1 putative uncharacterized protein FLJ37770 [Lingula anatina]
MVATLGNDAPSYATVKRWVAKFKQGKESIEDDAHPGRPVTVATPEMVNKVYDIVMTDRRVTERYVASTHFVSDYDVIGEVEGFLNGQEKGFYKSGIEALKTRWQKCIDTQRDYVEK